MNEQDTKRPYKMSKRAESAAQTERAIFDAAADLWRERAFSDITLDAIAERAGVSVRTIIRRHGSKEGLYETGIQNDTADMQAKRDLAEAGDIEGALDYLLLDYETYGDAVIRTLAVEDQIDAARKVLEAGRKYHRQWCEKVFAPFLPESDDKNYEQRLTSFVVASDIYLWKLLRRDLNKDLAVTRKTFQSLLLALSQH